MKKRIRRKGHWSDSENGRKAYKSHLQELKEYNKSERERLSKIIDFEKGDEVTLLVGVIKPKQVKEKVLRIYDKTYKVSLGYDDYVLIHKEQLSGYPNSIIKDASGDGRRYIDENIKLSKHQVNPILKSKQN